MKEKKKSIFEKEKELWRNYYKLQEKTFEYINDNTNLLDSENGLVTKYIREIRYTEDEEVLREIEKRINKLEKEYFKVAETKKLHDNFPMILKNVRNININSFVAKKSFAINILDENLDSKLLDLAFLKINLDINKDLTYIDIKKYEKQYKLFLDLMNDYNDKGELIGYTLRVAISHKDLLNLAKANKLQIHMYTGTQYILNVRKFEENKSKRYKYGYVILDRKAIIQKANKQAQRSHSFNNTLDIVEFPFHTNISIYIKEKKTSQMNMFEK